MEAMRKLIALLIGLTPLGIGYFMNDIMMQNQHLLLPYWLIGLIFLVVWCLVGYLTGDRAKFSVPLLLFAHLPALIALILNLYQEIILGQYWANWIGKATQFFFLPLVNIAAPLAFWSSRFCAVYVAATILMAVAYALGAFLKTRKARRS